MALPLLISIFVISICGLVYELTSAALASYLLGDSVTQFSTVIGVYLFAMGVGSFLAKHVERNILAVFIQIEFLIGIVGGFSAAALFTLFSYASSFRLLLYCTVFIIGMLVGVEIPLLMRILKDRMEFKDLVSKVLTFDYIGALIASVLFPILLAPHLGLIRTCLLFGLLNALVGLWTLLLFKRELGGSRLYLHPVAFVTLAVLLIGFAYAEELEKASEVGLYSHPIIYSKSSPYQRVVVTRQGDDMRLHLNGHLQFSSRDEYRYHEALVHVGLQSVIKPQTVLILGGGDGLAAREILRHSSVKQITLVDLDPAITDLARSFPLLRQLNQDSLHSDKLQVINHDAFIWLRDNQQLFDFIVIDFPDPTNFSVGKLYTTSFFRTVKTALAPNGLIVVQSSSPLLARRSFWCVHDTIESVGLVPLPYHLYVPSFGEWGFVLAGHNKPHLSTDYLPGLHFLTADTAVSMLHFPKDMGPVEVEPNRLNNQILVRYYDEEWSEYQ